MNTSIDVDELNTMTPRRLPPIDDSFKGKKSSDNIIAN